MELSRPGISKETLETNEVRLVDSIAAKELCDINQPGLWIPYHGFDGQPIRNAGSSTAYGRLRLRNPEPGKGKYHQAKGTGQHLYIPRPVQIPNQDTGDYRSVWLVEGEFKALALRDLGVNAYGISGFWGWRCEEMKELRGKLPNRKLWLLGDTDTATNPQFIKAALDLAKEMDLEVALPRMPLRLVDGSHTPKGIDDWADKATPEVQRWIDGVMERGDHTVEVGPKSDLCLCAGQLMELHGGNLRDDESRPLVVDFLAGFAQKAGFDSLVEKVEATTRHKGTTLKKDARTKAKELRETRDEGLSRQDVEWFKEHCYRVQTKYVVKQRDGGENDWTSALTTQSFRNYLLAQTATGEQVTDIQAWVDTHHAIDYAGPISGRQTGLQRVLDQECLVTKSYSSIATNSTGTWDGLRLYLENFFGKNDDDPEWECQFESFIGVLKQMRIHMRNPDKFYRKQAIFFCGPAQNGKSALQAMISEWLGGRGCNAAMWLCGKSNFNGEAGRSEHLVVTDSEIPPDSTAKNRFQGNLKSLVSSPFVECNEKYQPSITIMPTWLVSVSMNLDSGSMGALPSLDDGNADKFCFYRTYEAWDFDAMVRSGTGHVQDLLREDYAAFLSFVDDFEPSKIDRSAATFVAAYQHPELIERGIEASVSGDLADFLQVEGDRLKGEEVLSMTASEWLEYLRASIPATVSKLTAVSLGRRFAELGRAKMARIEQVRDQQHRRWVLRGGK